MEMLINIGASVVINEPDCDGFPALHRFVLLNDIQSVKFILHQPHINIDKAVHDLRTPLFLCAEKCYVHIARELLHNKAYLHTIDSTG